MARGARRGPRPREISDLAQDLLRGQGAKPEPPEKDAKPSDKFKDAASNQWGRAVVLVGAGCSYSAGIPLASGVAEEAAVHLLRKYEPNSRTDVPAEALDRLIEAGRIPSRYGTKAGGPYWSQLYTHVFSEHIKHPVEQRSFIGSFIKQEEQPINWAHVCLGGLVEKRFVHTILTTNFDQLALQGVIRTGIVPVVADGLESLNRISPTPDWPQVVHLHGSMHTYELRNSQTALSETERDRGMQVMLMSILREATALIIVGYAGGEEGIMALLRHASEALPRMVAYWIAFEDDYSKFSVQARAFLERGENKFFISGQDADQFFNGLIGELKIGAPSWIEYPLRTLSNQAMLSADNVLPWGDVRRLVESYKKRVNDVIVKHAPEVEPAERATLHLSARRFKDAAIEIELVEGGYRDKSDLLRIHARSLHLQYDKSATPEVSDLLNAIEELELLNRLGGGVVIRDVELLVEAYRDELEVASLAPEKRAEIPKLMGQAAARCLGQQDRSTNPRDWSLMRFYEAEAAQQDSQLRDTKTDERIHDENARTLLLIAAREAYNDALPGLIAKDSIRARECKEGLAASLSSLAELLSDTLEKARYLREAQTLFREVMEFSRVNTPDDRYAGSIENLVNLLRTSRKLLPEQAPAARQEEERLLSLALALYEETADVNGIKRVREALGLSDDKERGVPISA